MKPKAGDKVRSYDFPLMRTDCYVEGVVEKVGPWAECPGGERCHHYHIRATKKVWGGVEEPFETHYFPPVEDWPASGVKKIEEEN